MTINFPKHYFGLWLAGLAIALLSDSSADIPGLEPANKQPLMFLENQRGRVPDVVTFPKGTRSSSLIRLPLSLLLRDGSVYEGEVLEVSAAGITYKLRQDRTVTFRMSEIVEVVLRERGELELVPIKLLLRDGSLIVAQNISLAGDKFSCELGNHHLLELPRALVAEVTMGFPENTLDAMSALNADDCEPLPALAWKRENSVWHVKDGMERATLSKRFLCPRKMVVEFTTNRTDFGLVLFRANNSGSYGSISMLIENNALTLSQYDGKGYVVPTVKQPLFTEAVTHHHVMYWDAESGMLDIWRNGVRLGSYQFSKVALGDISILGNGLSFYARGGFELSSLKVSPWTGYATAHLLPEGETDALELGPERVEHQQITGISGKEISLADGRTVTRDQPMRLHLHQQGEADSAEGGVSPMKIETIDGSILAVTGLNAKDGTAEIHLACGASTTVPLAFLWKVTQPAIAILKQPAAGEWNPDTLTLADGTQLDGNCQKISPTGEITWKISACSEVITFLPDKLKSLRLHASGAPPQRPGNVVELGNRTWIPVELLAVDEQDLTVKTFYHPSFKIPRERVRALYFGPGAAAVTDGGPSEAWQQSSQIYDYNLRAYRYEPSIISKPRYVDGIHSLRMRPGATSNPDRLTLSLPQVTGPMAVECTTSTQRSLMLLDDQDRTVFSISLGGGNVQIYRYAVQTKGAQIMGISNTERFNFRAGDSGKSHHFAIIMDPINKRLHIHMDGASIGVCKLKASNPWRDVRKISFYSVFSTSSSNNLRNLWIHPAPCDLDGQVKPSASEPWISFANGDSTAAASCGYANNQWSLETELLGEIKVPAERINAMIFAPVSVDDISPCRVRLHSGGCLQGTALKLTAETVEITTQIGEFSIPLKHVSEVVFPPS